MKFHFVETVDEVLEVALLPSKVDNPMKLDIAEEKKVLS